MSHRENRIDRREIDSLLGQLRRRIRRYVLIEGTALLLAALGLLFWISLAVDWAYFQLSHLDLPKWFRVAYIVVVAGLAASLLVGAIGLRLLRSYRAKALALVLERRFPELDDRLITAVELAESHEGHASPLTASMLQRTVDEVVRATRTLDLGEVFERRPLRRAVVLATVLVASIGGFAFANSAAFNRWKDGYLELQDEYWTREYGLVVRVVAQPGDVVKEFQDFEYKHPRGGDLTLLIEVAEGKKVPERVQIHYEMTDGRGTGRATCSRIGDRQFQYSFGGLLDGLDFWVTGGDFTNRTPYRILVVDPPRVDQIVLASRYPEYTRLQSSSETGRHVVPVQGTQVSLPMETDFLMQASVNKPLVSVRIQFDPYEIRFGTGAATLTRKSEEGRPESTTEIAPEFARRFFSADRRSFAVPFVLSDELTDAARSRNARLETPLGPPFRMPSNSVVRITLEDTDDIVGSEPARLTVNGIADQPPVIETQLKGIGTSITRKAVIPVAGLISDDYGIAEARFEFQVDGSQEWEPREFERGPSGQPRDFRLQMSGDWEFERFAVLERELNIGQKLTLAVFARDGDDVNGPHKSYGERYAFTIVSEEELMSIIYQKELNLRRRFEQVITELEETRKDLLLHRTRAEELAGLESGAADEAGASKRREIEEAVSACAERALLEIQMNANETAAIEASFGDIREELVNNAVHTPEILERIDDRIVAPLQAVNTQDFPALDEALALFKMAAENRNDPTADIDQSVDRISTLILHMQSILREMRKLETFQEALELLKSIIEEEQQLLEKTKAEQKRKLIQGLDLQ